jgi:hypothetical protein
VARKGARQWSEQAGCRRNGPTRQRGRADVPARTPSVGVVGAGVVSLPAAGALFWAAGMPEWLGRPVVVAWQTVCVAITVQALPFLRPGMPPVCLPQSPSGWHLLR